MILLNPGPVVLSDRVRKALLKPDLCHREIEFTQLQNSIREKLLAVYDLAPDEWVAILLTGSGTSAMEAMISSLVPQDGKLLVVENGVYGERLAKIADIYQLDHRKFSLAWGEEINVSKLEEVFASDEQISHLAVVHHETTTGRLNNISSIGKLCKRYGVKVLLDGVSSFGAEEIDFETWGIAACAATANKCLHAVPGTSFVISRRDLLPAPDSRKRNLYLDLETYYSHQEQGGTPFTQSVQTFYALDEALNEMQEEGGWPLRYDKYKALAVQIREGLAELGIKALMPLEYSSVVLNTYYLPEGINYDQLHDHLKDNGFVIYAGQGDLSKTMFRVSTMGELSSADMDDFLTAIKNLIGDAIS